jgi:hypothetical protein
VERSTPSSSAQIAATASSVSPAGASYPRAANASLPGAGSALRSTLPLGVSGIASSRTYAAGTMCSGSRSARCAFSASTATGSPAR